MEVANTSAGRSIEAILILDSEGKKVGKILVHYGTTGRVWVNVWNWEDEENPVYGEGMASGFGYDKKTYALSKCGVPFGGEHFKDHTGTTFYAGLDMLRNMGYRVEQVL